MVCSYDGGLLCLSFLRLVMYLSLLAARVELLSLSLSGPGSLLSVEDALDWETLSAMTLRSASILPRFALKFLLVFSFLLHAAAPCVQVGYESTHHAKRSGDIVDAFEGLHLERLRTRGFCYSAMISQNLMGVIGGNRPERSTICPAGH